MVRWIPNQSKSYIPFRFTRIPPLFIRCSDTGQCLLARNVPCHPLPKAHERARRSSCATISPTMNTTLAKPSITSIMKKPTRSLTFDANILAEAEEAAGAREEDEEEEEEAVLAPPSSKVPALLMVAQKDLRPEAREKPQADSVSSSAPTGPTASATSSAAPTPANSPEGTNEPTVSSDESKQSRSSRRSKFSTGSESVKRVGSDEKSGYGGSILERTLTQQTLDSQVDHTAETLRARLGVRSGMVSGAVLHDASVALGLTRFSEQDVNLLVNRLAAA